MNLHKVFAFGAVLILGILVGFIGSKTLKEDKIDERRVLSTSQVASPIPTMLADVHQFREGIKAKVVKIIDGDTIVLASGQTVRLIGIDAPEVNDCFSSESTNQITSLILNKEVALEADVSETDRYQRLLRYVWADSSTSSEQVIFVNDFLVREGFATARDYPPDSKFKEQFAKAEIEAKENNRGLWSVCTSEPGESKPGLEDKDCSDFKTHAEAQVFFDSQGPGDPHKLDSDGDGLACESLP